MLLSASYVVLWFTQHVWDYAVEVQSISLPQLLARITSWPHHHFVCLCCWLNIALSVNVRASCAFAKLCASRLSYAPQYAKRKLMVRADLDSRDDAYR